MTGLTISRRGGGIAIAMGAALVAGAAPARMTPAHTAASTTWLIVQSAADPLALVGTAAVRRAPGARVMAGAECAELRAGLYVLAIPAGNALPAARPAGAYIKRCTPKPGSVAALGLPVVDPSFAAMRDAPVTFDGTAIVSRVRSGLLLRPWYTPGPDDPREGLRTAVDDVAGARRPIERDCTGPEVARDATHIAIACAIEQVGEALVYRTIVYRARDLARVRVEQRCRNPRLSAGAMRCDAQIIDASGRITLAPRRVSL